MIQTRMINGVVVATISILIVVLILHAWITRRRDLPPFTPLRTVVASAMAVSLFLLLQMRGMQWVLNVARRYQIDLPTRASVEVGLEAQVLMASFLTGFALVLGAFTTLMTLGLSSMLRSFFNAGTLLEVNPVDEDEPEGSLDDALEADEPAGGLVPPVVGDEPAAAGEPS